MKMSFADSLCPGAGNIPQEPWQLRIWCDQPLGGIWFGWDSDAGNIPVERGLVVTHFVVVVLFFNSTALQESMHVKAAFASFVCMCYRVEYMWTLIRLWIGGSLWKTLLCCCILFHTANETLVDNWQYVYIFMFAVQALTESLNSFLMGDHPSGLKLLTLKFLLVLITVSILLLLLLICLRHWKKGRSLF